MSLTVGFPARRLPLPSAWTEAVPGLSPVPGASDDELLERLRRGELDAACVQAEGPAGGGSREEHPELVHAAVPLRPEPRDLLVPAEGTGAATLHDLPDGARIALDGARRRAFLAAHRPGLAVVALPDDPIRTVRPFLRGGGADAVVLASGVARAAGLSDAASEILDPKAWTPGPGQGAWVLLARADDPATREALAPLHHPPTAAALEAERAVGVALGMDPDGALGALALPYGRWLRLWALLASPDGRRVVRGDLSGSDRDPTALGRSMADLLRSRGVALLPGVPPAPDLASAPGTFR